MWNDLAPREDRSSELNNCRGRPQAALSLDSREEVPMIQTSWRRQLSKFSRRHLAAFLRGVLVILGAPLSAQEIEATASPDGSLLVRGMQFLSDGCLSAGPFTSGAPVGVTEISNAQPFTLPISHDGAAMCVQMVSEVPFEITVRDNRSLAFVVIYRTYSGFPKNLPELNTAPRGQIIMKGFLE